MKKYVFLALIIIFGISILSGYMTYKSTNSENEIPNSVNPQNIVENVDNTTQIMTEDEQIISEIETVTDINSTTQIQEENTEKTLDAKKTSEVKQNNTSTLQVATAQKQTVDQGKQENNNNTPQHTKEESIPLQPEMPKQEVVKEENVTLGEEYKTNDTMINTIRNVINSNQSEDMQLYGYNIVVDSSIVEITSQFTYTEQRVIDKIKYKFDTIKIYARDYYNNGQFICTQCYII